LDKVIKKFAKKITLPQQSLIQT